MAIKFLSAQSPYTYVWHDSAGQSMPDNNSQISAKLSIDGINITIAPNAVISEPIIILNSAANENHAKNIVHIGSNAQVQIIEYLMADDQQSSNTTNTKIHCATGAQLKHCILQHASDKAGINQQSTTSIYQADSSSVWTNIFSFGGGLSKVELQVALQGANAECQASSLSYTTGSEKQAILLKIDHEHPHCNSNSLIRGVLKDKSTTDFTGKITVHPNASKTIAELQIKNILCSPKSQSVNQPQLEIYNDDVRCTHGSSTGQLDAEALFYMRSRGLDEAQATKMLISGFIQSVIARCDIPHIAEYVQNIITER